MVCPANGLSKQTNSISVILSEFLLIIIIIIESFRHDKCTFITIIVYSLCLNKICKPSNPAGCPLLTVIMGPHVYNE